MKILHTICGFGAKGGGTSTCTYDLLSGLVSQDPADEYHILTPDVTDPTDRLMGHGERWIHTVPADYVSPYCYSRNFRNALCDSDYDIYHTNGLWLYPNHITCAEARRRHRPYIITPHGMLYPEAMQRSSWKKRLIMAMHFRKDISRATCFHATCQREMETIRATGYSGPIALIGNPVSIPACAEPLRTSRRYGTRIVGYLGRLHPRKQVERILQAVAKLPDKSIRVLILGSGDEAYTQYLHTEVSRLGLTERTEFAGFVTGDDKFRRLATMDVLVVPSDMENFGMIIPEALITGTPVIASLGTPWQDLDTYRCGRWCPSDTDTLAEAISCILTADTDTLRQMGQRGADLVRNQYSADKIAARMAALYRWLIDGGDKPDFVHV